MATSAAASADLPQGSDQPQPRSASVVPVSIPRTVQSQGVDRPPAVHEIETQREHLRLNLENWEKQWADVLRHERAKVQDDADMATLRRALTRAGACLALGLSIVFPIVTDSDSLQASRVGTFTLRELSLMGAVMCGTVMIASLWYAGHVFMRRLRFRKSRTRPLLPPERLDASQLLSSITLEGDPLYYRERDVDPEEHPKKTTFGWKDGFPPPPRPDS